MTLNIVEKIDDQVKINNVLISVSDKQGLKELVLPLVEQNPDLRIYSTGGTFQRLSEILGKQADEKLVAVSQYTGQPETQGGLVKTLDFKIYLGLLTETYNADHQADLARTAAVAIDMVVVNLYPFGRVIASDQVSLEQARGNIDIGGPCMIRAAAKNFIRVAAVVDPADYPRVLNDLTQNSGMSTLGTRFRLAQKAFEHTARYDRTIADFLSVRSSAEAYACYKALEKK